MTHKELTTNYLTESLLESYLHTIFKETEIVRDKVVPQSNLKARPDFRIESHKLIVEFDGYGHFTNPITIVSDIKKDDCYTEMGYDIVRIPYFVQLDTFVLMRLFSKYVANIDCVTIASKYPHGFIDKKAILPANYCMLGLVRFERFLEDFNFRNISRRVIDSLETRVELEKNFHLVYPSTLHKKKWSNMNFNNKD